MWCVLVSIETVTENKSAQKQIEVQMMAVSLLVLSSHGQECQPASMNSNTAHSQNTGMMIRRKYSQSPTIVNCTTP